MERIEPLRTRTAGVGSLRGNESDGISDGDATNEASRNDNGVQGAWPREAHGYLTQASPSDLGV